jgi:acyl dehydratase
LKNQNPFAGQNISKFNISDFKIGDSYSFDDVVTDEMVDTFAELSGDFSSLHMNGDFALDRGFGHRVVHGVLLLGFLSRLVGMHFPGENAILVSLNTQFSSPAYPGDAIHISASVEQISHGTKTIVLKTTISNNKTNKIILKGRIIVGFTDSHGKSHAKA